MSLATARDFVRQFARNAGDSTSYIDSDIDRAIHMAGSHWCQSTKNRRTTATLSLSSGSRSLPAFPAGFRPDLMTRAWIAYSATSVAPNLELIGYDDLDTRPTSSGTPSCIAFTTTSTGIVYPTPSDNLTLNVEYVLPFPTWTYGTTSTVTFDLPDEDMLPIVALGAPAILQHNEPEHAYASAAWQQFEQAISRGVRRTFGNTYRTLEAVSAPQPVEEERELP